MLDPISIQNRKFLIFSGDHYIQSYFETLINEKTDLEPVLFKEPLEFEGYLRIEDNKNESYGVILSSREPSAEFLYQKLIKMSPALPILLLYWENEKEEVHKKYKSHALVQLISMSLVWEDFIQQISKAVKIHERSLHEHQFFKVNPILLKPNEHNPFDIYIKQSNHKYDLVFPRNKPLSQKDIQQLLSGSTQFNVYLKTRDFYQLLKMTNRTLSKVTPSQRINPSQKEPHLLVLHIVEQLNNECFSKLGLIEESLNLTNWSVDYITKLLNTKMDLFETGLHKMLHLDYLSEHSVYNSVLSSYVCKQSPWNNEKNILSLATASIFHDLVLESSFLARVQTTKDLQRYQLNEKEKEQVLDHPILAASILKKLEGVPKSTEEIILNHHELYDGSGFPRGIKGKEFHPLWCIFNICHRITLFIFESQPTFEGLIQFLKEKEEEWTEGHFPKVLKILIELFQSTHGDKLEDLVIQKRDQ